MVRVATELAHTHGKLCMVRVATELAHTVHMANVIVLSAIVR